MAREFPASGPASPEGAALREAGRVSVQAEGLTVLLGRAVVLREVSFEAAPGQVTAVVGPNGAGKSSLLRTVAGLLPYRGQLRVAGEPATRLSARQRAQTMAYVPQRSQLQSALRVATVVDQGRFSFAREFPRSSRSKEQRSSVDAAMEALGVWELRDRRFTELSVGERRRVLLARAVATEAPVLLLDEPADALDVRHALELEALLKQLALRGRTVLLVVHSLAAVRRVADRVVVLERGVVRKAGPTAAVVNRATVERIYRVLLAENQGPAFSLPSSLSEGDQTSQSAAANDLDPKSAMRSERAKQASE